MATLDRKTTQIGKTTYPPNTRKTVLISGKQVRLLGQSLPQLVPGYARVQLHHVGICHSDLSAIRAGTLPEGSHLGHEASGVVIRSTAPEIAEGSRVIAYVDDAYASHVDVPAERIIVINEECTMLDAALAEPVACVIGGIERLKLSDVREIVLVGAGFMGLLALNYLSLLGHAVSVIEPVSARRELALRTGAVRVFSPEEVNLGRLNGKDVVIEATGSASGLTLASDLVGIGGTLGVLGYHQSEGGLRTIPMQRWNFRGISVLNLHHRDLSQVMNWIDRAQRSAARGAITPSAFVDAQYSLEQAPEALSEKSGSQTPLKAVFTLTTTQ